MNTKVPKLQWYLHWSGDLSRWVNMHLVQKGLQEVLVLHKEETSVSTQEDISTAVENKHPWLTVSFWIFPAREEWSPTCWNSEGLNRTRRLDFCLSQCFWGGSGRRTMVRPIFARLFLSFIQVVEVECIPHLFQDCRLWPTEYGPAASRWASLCRT